MNCTRSRSASTALLAATLLSLGAPFSAHACSKTPVHIQRFSENTVLFIGRATGDSVRTGPGDVKYSLLDGHFGRAGDRIIYGQTIDVESLSSIDRKLLPAGVKRVVLVPWDYGADCSPTPWTSSARWITPGTRGIYNAVLRNKSHWLSGVPVFDVYSPEYVPYTGSMRRGQRSVLGDSTWLSVDELYETVEHLPDQSATKLYMAAASEPFLAWARLHRSTVERYPLKELLHTTVYRLRQEEANRLSSIFAGTFRFTVSITGHSDRQFFLRTSHIGAQTWDPGREFPILATGDGTHYEPIVGIDVYTSLAPTLTALPVTCRTDNVRKEAWVELMLNPETSSGGVRTWSGQIGWDVVSTALSKDPTLAEFRVAWTAELKGRLKSDADPQRARIFAGNAEGITRIADTFTLSNGHTLTLRGERVSNQVVTCPNMY